MKIATAPEEQHSEEPQYKSRVAQNYIPTTTVTPEEEAEILGKKRTLEKTYQRLEDCLKESEEEIKSIGLENKSGIVLFAYNLLDKFGIYPKERLIDKEITRIEDLMYKLERAKEQYDESTDKARKSCMASENKKYKAELLVEKYDGMVEALDKEFNNLGDDAKAIKEKLKQGDKTPGLREKFLAIKNEMRNIRYDIRTIKRDRDRAAIAIVKSDGKTTVYRQNELIRDNIQYALAAQYDRLDVLRERMSDLKEIGKNKSLLAAVKLLKDSESNVKDMIEKAKKYEETAKKTVKGLQEAQLDALPIDTGTVENLEELNYDRQSQAYIAAQKIMQRDEDADLV